MKKTLNTLLLIFCLCFAKHSLANNKVAILDTDKIIQEAVAVIDIQKKVEKKKIVYEAEINKKQSALMTEQKKMQDKKNITSKENLEKEAKSFEEKVDNLKSFVDKKQNSLKNASLDAMNKVNDAMKIVVANLSKEKEIDIIIPSSQVIYFQEHLDITAEVLELLNKKITKVEIKFEN
jgi:Skp family chaperone for outer membrane proteins